MFRFLVPLLATLLVLPVGVVGAGSETWRTGYTGIDANGPHVLGYWKFAPGAATNDSSGKGHHASLVGAVGVAEGKFDGALESFPGWPVTDKRHAAIVSLRSALSPKGAFTLELWLKPKAELTPKLSPVLVDKKYAGNTDYQLRLSAADKGGDRRLQVSLGFGTESETFHSEPFSLDASWQHVAFTYDGAGEVRFFRNGAPLGTVLKPGRGSVVPGKVAFCIGDRAGSYYSGFPGFIDEVRLCDKALEFRPVAVEFRTERKAWLRMEKAKPVSVTVRNLSKAPANDLKLRLSLEGSAEEVFAFPALAAGAIHEVSYDVDTALRPDTYRLKATLEMTGDPPFVSEEFTDITIASRPLARMPVMMWGIGSAENVRKEMARLKDLGFTHCLGGGADYGAIWAAKKPVAPGDEDRIANTREMLDYALANDFGIAFSLSPGHWLKERKDLRRVDRSGKPYVTRTDVNASLPGLTNFCFNVGASVAWTYGAFPAWKAVLINTEVRDSSQPSFSEFNQAAYRKFSGGEIPAEVVVKGGVDWTKLKEFPADRVIPDDHPLLKYYQWLWSVGDGWNALHTAVHRGVHSTGRDDVWTWFDPAIRAASIGGSGGSVDVLGQWTYSNPDPVRIGYFADETIAMAENSAQHPRVMKMTQLFWYRSQTAPKKAGTNYIASPFDDHDPDAAYITIAPVHLRESFWTKLARPISGLMYHGWQALVPTESSGGYRYTHPDTKEEFRRLHRAILEPLGPTLLQLEERQSEVAYLDSFTAQMFARRGSYGYSNDETYLALLFAQLQPKVIYEEQLLREGLDTFKVLVLANCDVLTRSVVKRIHEFQQRGGLVAGDENLVKAVKPDILIARITRTRKADADKRAILDNAARLRAALDSRYARPAECSNPEILTRLRHSGMSDYLFVVNDRREFGNYVGQHGLVMENGLPAEGRITLRRGSGHVYDLLVGREVPAMAGNGSLAWNAALGPGEGTVYLATPKAIHSVAVSGSLPDFHVVVADETGQPIPAVIPLQVEISDPAGRLAEFSGFHAAKDGILRLHLDVASNDTPGLWQIRVHELASGQRQTHYFRVQDSRISNR